MNTEAVDRLDTFIAEGRLIRHMWGSTNAGGQELACLLVALSPEVGPKGDVGACPASLMPQWLAYLTPWLDDAGSIGAWPSMVRRYAGLARRWHVLTAEEWVRLDYAVRGVVLRDLVQTPAIAAVAALCDRAADGDMPTKGEWSAAWSAAWSAESAAWSAAWSAESAAWSAASAAGAAWSAASAASAASVAGAATSATSAASAASAAWSAESAAWSAASEESAAADRMTKGILDVIEKAVDAHR